MNAKAKPENPLQPKQLKSMPLERQMVWARYSHDGDFVWMGGYDALIRRWDMRTITAPEKATEKPTEKTTEKSAGKPSVKPTAKATEEPTPGPQPLPTLKEHHGWVTGFAKAGNLICTCDSWGALCCWSDDETPKLLWKQEAAHKNWVRTITATTVGGQPLFVTGGDDHAIVVWNADGKEQLRLEGHTAPIFCFTFHPSGTLVSGDMHGHVKEWDLKSGKTIRSHHLANFFLLKYDQKICGLRGMQFLDDGKTLLASGSHPTSSGRMIGIPTLELFDWETGKQKQLFKQGASREGYVFDCAVLGTAEKDHLFITVTSGSPTTGQLILQKRAETEPVIPPIKIINPHSLDLHPNGKQFIIISTNRNSQGNGTVKDKAGNYLGNFSELSLYQLPETV